MAEGVLVVNPLSLKQREKRSLPMDEDENENDHRRDQGLASKTRAMHELNPKTKPVNQD